MNLWKLYQRWTPAAIVSWGQLGTPHAKTTYGLLRHSRLFKPVCVIAEYEGRMVSEFVSPVRFNVPIVSSIEKAKRLGARVVIVGVSNPGGYLEERIAQLVKDALSKGLDVLSGLHFKISQQSEFLELARKSGSKIIDIRVPPSELRVFRGDIYKKKVKVVGIFGTDCVVGKRTTAVQLWEKAIERGMKAGFMATGQTGILIGADAGYVIDAIPADFVPGVVERTILELERRGMEVVFVEGQGALRHPAYGQVTIGLLYGSNPDIVFLVHDPSREHFESFPKVPKKPEFEEERKLIETLSNARVLGGVCLSGSFKTDLPVYNPFDPADLDEMLKKVVQW
ncbi:DUF1611 domain-containing protein [Thermotoga sp. KOL6]|uniref:DUF1611 domain-containing protein n=1 Tax=Thermotoga sp. KOL6 TaxID=126741 RepID=UPI000C7773EA|nr:DUF1611 domain-containing protein [Thermotoga sp. KOL6]PLV59491.1 hypothetical protein AS005_07050 [Thermotoga sp. KOL6]